MLFQNENNFLKKNFKKYNYCKVFGLENKKTRINAFLLFIDIIFDYFFPVLFLLQLPSPLPPHTHLASGSKE